MPCPFDGIAWMKTIFTTLAIFSIGYLGVSASKAEQRVPRGFEALAQGQTILTDVTLFGHSLGVFQSRVDLESVQFMNPEALATVINKTYPDAPALRELLHRELGKQFSRNGNLACSSSGNAPGCDFLTTDTTSIIYDENNARVFLFIGSRYLPEKKQKDIFYATTADTHNALIHQQNINFVADRNYQSASAQGNGSLGITDSGYLNIDWNWQGQRFAAESIQNAIINNGYYRQDFLKKNYLQAGIMDARDIFSNAGGNINLSQLPLGKMRGIRMGSTLAWVDSSRISRGTPVSVFLSRDARVDAYRGEQLLASFYLKAGAQELDSRAFPTGSYTLTLRVYEDNQLVRTETLPYTGLGGSGLNTLQWFFQAGTPDRKNVQDTETEKRVIQAGVRLPSWQNTALTMGTAFFSTTRYWEGAIDWSHGFDSGWIDGLMTSRASYLYGNEGSRGNIQQINYNDGFSLSFYRSALTADNCNSQNAHRFSFNGCYKSTNVMLSVPLSNWYGTLSYAQNSHQGRYVYREDLNDADDFSRTGLPWEKIYQTRTQSRTWQAGITRTFNVNGININTGINAFMRHESNAVNNDRGFFVSLSLSGSQHESGGKQRTVSAGTSWQSSRRGENQLGYNVAYSQYGDDSGENEAGFSLDGFNTDTITSSAYGRAGGQYGTGSLAVSDVRQRAGSTHLLSSSGNYSSSVIIDRQGVIPGRWGDGTPSSAVTVDVAQADQSEKSMISVSVDSGDRSDVQGNSRALFTVPGYREITSDVTESLTSSGGTGSEISKGTGVRKIFMPPGKVFSRKVKVETRYTWLGQLLDEQHRPLEGAIPLNVMSWSPLGRGNFMLETTEKIKALYLMKDNTYWQCMMRVKVIRDVIRYVGTTQCLNTTLANIPEAEQKQIELMTANSRRQMKPTAMNN